MKEITATHAVFMDSSSLLHKQDPCLFSFITYHIYATAHETAIM